MEKQLKVEEVYECLAQLNGFQGPNITILGFCNEKSISEGMRRIANKVAKKLQENWPKEQLEIINSYKDEGLSDVEIAAIKQGKIKDLMESVVTMDFEELPDFKILDNRLEERKESLSHNYTYLFEKLFLNY